MINEPVSSPLAPPIIAVAGAIEDHELSRLLHAAVGDAGFTAADVAETLFAPAAVRARGTLLTARDPGTHTLLGMIVLVAPDGAARQIARGVEAEAQVLAVSPEARRQGVGRALVRALMTLALSRGWRNLVLSTQEAMHPAQALYAREGFVRMPGRDWNRTGRRFLVFGIEL